MTLFDQLLKQVPKHVYLREACHNDVLSVTDLELIIRSNGSDSAHHAVWENLMDWDTHYEEQHYLKEAVDDLSRELGKTKHFIMDQLQIENEDWQEAFRYALWDRDASTPIEDMARHTDDVILRLEMYSNHDCINSLFCEGRQHDLQDSYMADSLRVLRINPKNYQCHLIKNGHDASHVMDVYRGEPLLSADALFMEHQELSSGPALLTFVFALPADEVLKFKGQLVVPAGAKVGFFSSAVGAGSIFEAETQASFSINLVDQPETYSEPTFGLFIDDSDCKHCGYSIEEVYGMPRNWINVRGSIYPELNQAA